MIIAKPVKGQASQPRVQLQLGGPPAGYNMIPGITTPIDIEQKKPPGLPAPLPPGVVPTAPPTSPGTPPPPLPPPPPGAIAVSRLGLMFPPEGGTTVVNVNDAAFMNPDGTPTDLGAALFRAMAKSHPNNWELSKVMPPGVGESQSMRKRTIQKRYDKSTLYSVDDEENIHMIRSLPTEAAWWWDFVLFLTRFPDSNWLRIGKKADKAGTYAYNLARPFAPADVTDPGFLGVPFMTFRHPNPQFASSQHSDVPVNNAWALYWRFKQPVPGDHRHLLEITMAPTPPARRDTSHWWDGWLLYVLFPPALLWKVTFEALELVGVEIYEILETAWETVEDLLGDLWDMIRQGLCALGESKLRGAIERRETWADEAAFNKLVKDNVSPETAAQIGAFMVGGPITAIAAQGLAQVLRNTVCSQSPADAFPPGAVCILDPDLARYRVVMGV